MGGTIMLALPIVAAMGVVLLMVVGVALIAFIAATVVSIVLAAGTKKRRAEGRKLNGVIAVPIILYVLSVPVLVWFATSFAFPIIDAELTVRYDDCSVAIVGHEPAALQDSLENLTEPLPQEGQESWESLLRLAVEYGDEECVRVIFDQAGRQQVPLDVDKPLPSFDYESNVTGSVPSLLLALGFNYGSPAMIRTLLDEGANPSIAVSAEAGIVAPDLLEGETPLHLACRGVAGVSVYVDSDERDALQVLQETDEVVDLLLAYGADPSAVDGEGRTPWQNYAELVDGFVQSGDLGREEAASILEARRPSLAAEGEFLV